MDDGVFYPIGQQDFRKLREDRCVYIDKTGYIAKIIASRNNYFFLARPRRFGKSLFLSTLQYFFEGQCELFRGLAVDTPDREWVSYPVLRLDLNVEKYDEPGILDMALNRMFRKWEQLYGVTEIAETLSGRFQSIIDQAYLTTGRRVVILVDEYDKPLVSNLNRDDNFEHYRAKLASLYSNFKSSAAHIQLVFLTGVSRFSKLSIFSDINNLNDITFDDDYADICGITADELRENLDYGIRRLAEYQAISFDEACIRLKRNYDGYRFAKRGSDIYNPWSVLNCLAKRDISNYWSQTGKPTLIAEALKHMDVDLERTLHARFPFRILAGLDLKSTDPTSLLYQTGYLTIKDYCPATDTVTVGVPNKEVKESLFEELLPFYLKVKRGEPIGVVFDIIDDVRNGDPHKLVRDLDIFLSGVPYEMRMDDENNLHNAIYILLTLIGIEADTEVHTSDGRIDLTIKTLKYIYIIELKFDRTPQEAMQQIIDKHYALPYARDQRQLFMVGINFSSTTRHLDAPVIQ